MRITNSMTARITLNQLAQGRTQLARTQEQASSGLRINRPSDDPVDYQTTQRLKGFLGQTDRFLRSLDSSRIRMGATENALADAGDLLSQARVTSIEAANGTNLGENYEIYKNEIESLFDQLMDKANARSSEGAYIFGGRASDRPPFSVSGPFVSGSPAPTVTFDGEASNVAVEIDREIFIDVSFDGSRVFEGAANSFEALRDLWTALDQQDQAAVIAAQAGLEDATDQLFGERARIGNSGATADRVEATLGQRQEELAERLSITQDADVYEVYSDLVQQETALQGTLQVSSNLLGLLAPRLPLGEMHCWS